MRIMPRFPTKNFTEILQLMWQVLTHTLYSQLGTKPFSNTDLTPATAVYVLICMYRDRHVADTFMHSIFATNPGRVELSNVMVS